MNKIQVILNRFPYTYMILVDQHDGFPLNKRCPTLTDPILDRYIPRRDYDLQQPTGN